MNEFSTTFVSLLRLVLPPGISLQMLVLLLAIAAVASLGACLLLLVRVSRLHRERREAAEALAAASRRAAEAEALGETLALSEARLTTLLESERRHATEKLTWLEEARDELRLQFSQLAQGIMDDKTARLSELNREKLAAILEPFNAQLTALKQEINEVYRHDSRERLSLKSEILQLRDLNQQVNREAVNLTRALKGDTRIQGNWGELVLERVLEKSGLRRGIEYETQGGFRDSEQRLMKPDVLVHLPQGKDIIIDSKVSLLSWERYVNCEREEERAGHLRELVRSVRDHIHSLSGKNYPSLFGIRSLDFVLMFLPIEAAYSAVLQQEDQLFAEALGRNIIVVTPTTLLATLRTVENIWQLEQQSRNSLEIARRAGLMYDKFRGFVEEMEKIGRQLAACHGSYDNALMKLTQGRGNLIAQAEQLRELGVQVKKELPRSITDLAESELKN